MYQYKLLGFLFLMFYSPLLISGDYLHTHYKLDRASLKITNGMVKESKYNHLIRKQLRKLTPGQVDQIETIRANWIANYDVVKLGGVVPFETSKIKWNKNNSIPDRKPYKFININRVIEKAMQLNPDITICLPISIKTDIKNFKTNIRPHIGKIPNFKKWIDLASERSKANCMFIDWATPSRTSPSTLRKMVKYIHQKKMKVVLNSGHHAVPGSNAISLAKTAGLRKGDYLHEEGWYWKGNNRSRKKWKADSLNYTKERGSINRMVTKNRSFGWIANIKPTTSPNFDECYSKRVRKAVKMAYAYGASHISVQKDNTKGIVSNCLPWKEIIAPLSKSEKRRLRKRYR